MKFATTNVKQIFTKYPQEQECGSQGGEQNDEFCSKLLIAAVATGKLCLKGAEQSLIAQAEKSGSQSENDLR